MLRLWPDNEKSLIRGVLTFQSYFIHNFIMCLLNLKSFLPWFRRRINIHPKVKVSFRFRQSFPTFLNIFYFITFLNFFHIFLYRPNHDWIKDNVLKLIPTISFPSSSLYSKICPSYCRNI